jgi:hypothetical protein
LRKNSLIFVSEVVNCTNESPIAGNRRDGFDEGRLETDLKGRRASQLLYFDSGYLGYEAAEGIDLVWELGKDALAPFGL